MPGGQRGEASAEVLCQIDRAISGQNREYTRIIVSFHVFGLSAGRRFGELLQKVVVEHLVELFGKRTQNGGV